MKMKKRYFFIMLVIIILLTSQFLNFMVDDYRVRNQMIKRNYSKEWRLLFINLQQLEALVHRSINSNEDYIYNNISMIIQETHYINDNLIGYSRINENFNVSIYSLIDILQQLDDKVESHEPLLLRDLEMVQEIISVSKEYDDIKKISIYDKPSSKFKLMALPDEVRSYVEALESLHQEYD